MPDSYPDCPSSTCLGFSCCETDFPLPLPTLISHIQGLITNIPVAPNAQGREGPSLLQSEFCFPLCSHYCLMSGSNSPMATLAAEPPHGPGICPYLPPEWPQGAGRWGQDRWLGSPSCRRFWCLVLYLSPLIFSWVRSKCPLVICSAHIDCVVPRLSDLHPGTVRVWGGAGRAVLLLLTVGGVCGSLPSGLLDAFSPPDSPF